MGSLPRTRPHRRSDKRQAPPAPAEAPAARKPTAARSAAVPPTAAKPTAGPARPAPDPSGPDAPGLLETAVQAAGELAEIGLHASARALRRAVSRLPHP
jgi:hypothetical protein